MCDPVSIGITALATAGTAAYIKSQTPKPPPIPNEPPPAPEPPSVVDPAVQAARTRSRDQTRASRGRQSTILTGTGGLTTPPTTAGKTLLGQ